VEEAVVEEVFLQRHVAQRRRAEQAAIFVPPFEVGAQRAAHAEIDIGGVGIGGNGRIAWHRHGDQAEIGELRRLAVIGRLAEMTGSAIALGRVFEQGAAMEFLRGQRALAGQKGVVAAGIGVEGGGVLLERAERLDGAVESIGGSREDVVAERRLERVGIGGPGEPCHHSVWAGIRHLERRQKRDPGLLGAAVDAAVPGQAAGRAVVDAFVALVLGIVEMLAEGGHRLQIAQRRHRALAWPVERRTAHLDRRGRGGGETMLRVMAGSACLPPRRRQRRVEEHLAAKFGQRGGTGEGLRPRQRAGMDAVGLGGDRVSDSGG